MTKIISAPSKYIQGKGELSRIKEHISSLGKSFFIIADDFVMNLTKNTIEESFKNSDVNLVFEKFNGECSKNEINRLRKIYLEKKCDGVIGIGGGKTFDTAKSIGYYEDAPIIIVPTIASTDSPCSSLVVMYTDDHVFDEYLMISNNPNRVIMDTDIIANSPVRLLVAGIGDALATYFEAQACMDAKAPNMFGAESTKSALALAKLCYETLLSDGYKAVLAAENNVSTMALENIIEANTYLSGIGFESGGLAAAHAIHNGFTVIDDCHHLYHGEKVAFGTIVQLILENRSMEEIKEVIEFCISVGLPVTLKDMGIDEINYDDIMKVAEAACAEGETIHNMPFEVTSEAVYAAILTANEIGLRYKNK